MTVEEAKVIYGDSNRDYYVLCSKCPLDETDKCLCETVGDCDGYGDTWERIADHFNKQNKPDEDDGCENCAHNILDKEHPICFNCGRHGTDNFEEKTCNNCKYEDKDFWEEPCNQCSINNEHWESPYGVPEPTETTDNVNHPSHYNNGGMECIDEMILIFGVEATKHFCLLNAWKYRYRANHKNGQEDLNKANWYIAKYKELSENE